MRKEIYVMRQSKAEFEKLDNLLESLLDEIKSDFWRCEIESIRVEIESELSRLSSILDLV
jgi:hypothetical protein